MVIYHEKNIECLHKDTMQKVSQLVTITDGYKFGVYSY